MKACSSTALFEDPCHSSEGLVNWTLAHDIKQGIRERRKFKRNIVRI